MHNLDADLVNGSNRKVHASCSDDEAKQILRALRATEMTQVETTTNSSVHDARKQQSPQLIGVT